VSGTLQQAPTASILLVDDSAANIELLNEILKPLYRVHFALDGESAMEIAVRHSPDLILLDVIMPDVDGYATCQQLKSTPETRDIPVIFITAMDRIEDEEKGLALGAVDYITKPFSPAIVRLRVANHIELKRQRDILFSLSQLDGLTGIANRRAFDGSLERFWHAQARKQLPLSVMMIDIDLFKRFNDHYGHVTGDDCLRRVASTLAGCVQRGQDTLARYGGEEFACLLPDADAEGVIAVGRRMLAAVRELAIPHAGSTVEPLVTISLGLSSGLPSQRDTPLGIVQRADEALYRSKNAGRARLTHLPL
jgi:diguanylate cyclase (GGDEF)-like protein